MRVCVCQGELDRANKEKEVVSSHNRHLEQRLTGGDSENGGATELERLRSQVEVSRPQGQRSPEVARGHELIGPLSWRDQRCRGRKIL